jgi:hypothetical protein
MNRPRFELVKMTSNFTLYVFTGPLKVLTGPTNIYDLTFYSMLTSVEDSSSLSSVRPPIIAGVRQDVLR